MNVLEFWQEIVLANQRNGLSCEESVTRADNLMRRYEEKKNGIGDVQVTVGQNFHSDFPSVTAIEEKNQRLSMLPKMTPSKKMSYPVAEILYCNEAGATISEIAEKINAASPEALRVAMLRLGYGYRNNSFYKRKGNWR